MSLAKIFNHSSIFIGALFVVLVAIFPKKEILYLKPFFYISLFGFYWTCTKKFNFLIVLLMLSIFFGEYLSAVNYVENFRLITIFYTLFYSFGIVLLLPTIKKIRVGRIDSLEFYIGLALLIFFPVLVVYIWLSSDDGLTKSILFVLNAMVFLVFLVSCFYIFVFGSHPKQFFILTVGFANLVSGLCSVINELYFQSLAFYTVVYFCDVLLVYCFVYFLIHKNEITEKKDWVL